MQLQDRVNLERVNYIITSYGLEGGDGDSFQSGLRELLQQYPQAWVELALIEVMIQHWHLPPMPKGLIFLQEVQHLLTQWIQGESFSSISDQQFQWITGLTPLAVCEQPVKTCEL
ncbi:MAG: hypothetical protein ACO3EZ_12865 [Prochlorotrichaceae cyanobacterium]